jgi:iduronate 2-sulfatase
MLQRKLTVALVGIVLLGGVSGVSAVTNERPNVLFFFLDDLRPELGCYGDKLVKSPNIDRLAGRSVLFERAYCQQAVCAPSRASVMSGLRPDSTGIYDLGHPLRRTKPDVMSLPQWFKERGYVTARFGKVYHHPSDDAEFWSEMPALGGKEYNSPEIQAQMQKLDQAAQAKGLKGLQLYTATRGPSCEAADVPDNTYPDGVTAEQAIESLRRNRTNAFFLCVGFTKPHLPFCAPKKYWDLYQRDQFPVPGRAKPEGVPEIALTAWGELRSYSDVRSFRGDLDDAKTREMIHGYHAAVSFSDAQVGKVLDELTKLGLADNTIIVLWGDHGWKLGDYGMWCKHTNFEIDTRVPLLVSAPGMVRGKNAAGLVEMVDIFPTLTELCGGVAPKQCEGKSLVPLLHDPAAKGREFAVSQYPREQERVMGYTIRNDRWRYTEWLDLQKQEIVARELYDQSVSLLPMRNLATEPENAELVAKLAEQLKPFQKAKYEPPKRPNAPARRKPAADDSVSPPSTEASLNE